MATVSFAGYTIWNDATTGVSAAAHDWDSFSDAQDFSMLPQGNGIVSVVTGLDPGGVSLQLQYVLSDAEEATLQSTLNSLRAQYGTVTYPGGSRAYCRMVGGAKLIRGETVNVISPASRAGIKHRYNLAITFKALR